MALWQMDTMGGVFLACGRELKLVSGLDDHSRYCVIARLVIRAAGRAVCRAFAATLRRCPAEVLFERICRENGITTGLTRLRTPHDGQDRTLAQDPAGGAPDRPRPVRQPRACPGRAGRLGRRLQPPPAAPVAGHGQPPPAGSLPARAPG